MSRHANSATEEFGPLKPAHGTALLRRLQNYTDTNDPSRAWELFQNATDEIKRLITLCENIHDRTLRGLPDTELRTLLREAWQGPNP